MPRLAWIIGKKGGKAVIVGGGEMPLDEAIKKQRALVPEYDSTEIVMRFRSYGKEDVERAARNAKVHAEKAEAGRKAQAARDALSVKEAAEKAKAKEAAEKAQKAK